MKILIATCAVLALSATAAMAECSYHSAKTSKSAEQQQQTATNSEAKTSDERQILLVKQMSSQPAPSTPSTVK